MSKVDYDLYQVKRGEEHSDLLFTNMSMIQKLKFKIEPSHYDKVCSGSTDRKEYVGEVLESLFVKFNLEFPADYRARSMSVSDVVVLHENGVNKAYFCDSIEFIEVPQFFQADTMVTMDTTGLAVDANNGHFGTWHTIDTKKIGGQDFHLMEHDEFNSEVAAVIVAGTSKVVAEDVWNGFSPEILAMIAEEQGLILPHPTSVNEANYLSAAEGYSEENYNMIDGRIDTQSKLTPGDDTASQPEQSNGKKSSVLEKLKEKQAEIPAKGKSYVFNTKPTTLCLLAETP